MVTPGQAYVLLALLETETGQLALIPETAVDGDPFDAVSAQEGDSHAATFSQVANRLHGAADVVGHHEAGAATK